MSDKEERMMELHKELDKMKKVMTPIEIINRNSDSINENGAKKFLFYFLDPHGNHGLDSELLDYMLDSVSRYTDFAHRYSLSELNNCKYEPEVKTAHGKQADGLMWLEHDFFICWEVKVDGGEESYDDLDLHQTEVYAEETDEFWKGNWNCDRSERKLKKESFEHHHYIYLTKKGEDKEPKSPSFDTITWELVANTFDNWLNKAMKKDDREYPTQTLLQVNMFIRSIRRSICDLDDETRRDLAELYIEYFEEISDIKT